MKRKRTHTILATITLISVILTSACTAGSANSTTSSVPETAVTTTAPAVTGTVMDRIDEPKAETTTAQTTAATAVTTTKPQETKKAETTVAQTTTVATTARPKPATTTTAATTKPAPEWTETKSSGTKYVNTDCYSRKKAVLGADTVKLYSVNDKVTVTAKTDTGYYKLDTGAYIHSDYLSDSKIVIQTTTTAKKAETPKPATTTKKQESKPKSIYEYPFDLEAIKKVIVDDAVNNYGLKNLDDPSWTPEGSTWFPPLVIWKGVNPNVIRMRVSEQAESSYTGGYMKKGDYFKVYIETIPDLKKDENGNSIEGYAIYFLRG